MPAKKSRGLVDYSGLPTAYRKFFEILPETEVEEVQRRGQAKKNKRM